MSTSRRQVRPRAKRTSERGQDGRRDSALPSDDFNRESPTAEQSSAPQDVQDESGAGDAGQARFDKIARRAHELYESRGGQHGRDLDDWFQAEQEIETQSRNR